MDIDAVVDELYGLPASDFTARRDELAAQLRSDGASDLAGEVRGLRRPTAAAALVNRLARDAAEALGDYLELGERMRAAQSRLAGDQLRALGQERQREAGALVRRAVVLAGGKVSAAVQQEVDATLRAAVADPAAAEAVASGRLTRALSYAGLGEVDISAAVASTPPARPRALPADTADAADAADAAGGEPEGAEPAPARTPRRRAPSVRDAGQVLDERRQSADHDLRAAQDDVQRAREEAELAAARAKQAADAQRDAEQEVDDLRERLAQARFSVRAAQQEVATAQAERSAAERAVTAAEKMLGKARHRRDLLGDD